MTQVKRAKVTIKSIINNLSDTSLPSGEREVSESIAERATMLQNDDGIISISFSEESEGGKITTEIRFFSGKIQVVKRGAINSNMLFSEKDFHSSLYSIPPYSFNASVFTRKIRGKTDEFGGNVDIFYDMEIGGARKSVKMKLVYEVVDGN